MARDIKMLEIARMIIWAAGKGFETVEPGTDRDVVILQGGGSGYGHVEYSEEFEIVLSPDASFSVSCSRSRYGNGGYAEKLGEGLEQLQEALEQIDEEEWEEEVI